MFPSDVFHDDTERFIWASLNLISIRVPYTCVHNDVPSCHTDIITIVNSFKDLLDVLHFPLCINGRLLMESLLLYPDCLVIEIK